MPSFEGPPFIRQPVSLETLSLPVTIAVRVDESLQPFGPDEEDKLWTYSTLRPQLKKEMAEEEPMVRIGITNGHAGSFAEISFELIDQTASVVVLDESDDGASCVPWSQVSGDVSISKWSIEEHSRVEVDLHGIVGGSKKELQVCADLGISNFEPIQPVLTRIQFRTRH